VRNGHRRSALPPEGKTDGLRVWGRVRWRARRRIGKYDTRDVIPVRISAEFLKAVLKRC
jgi:hypothetical protein